MDAEKFMQQVEFEDNGFIHHNGIRIVSVDEEKSVLEASVTEKSCNVWGIVHGGLLYAMADTAAGVLIRAKYGRKNVTLDGSMQYLRSTAGAKQLTAVAREIRSGQHVSFLEVDVTTEAGVHVARAQINMFFLN